MPSPNQVNETPVSWRLDDLDVNATLTRPQGAGPFPAVVFVAGSGPTDRNWNTPILPGANGSAALLAQALTAQGFVTLRYDKRPSGPLAQQNALHLQGKISMQSHLDELVGAVNLLVAREDVDTARLFIFGNSEGCIHAVNYQLHAANPPMSGIILSAPPARPMGAVARGQIAAQILPIPGGEAWLAAYDAEMADFTAGRPVTIDPTLPEGLRNMITAVTLPINQPFAGELWAMDLSGPLAEITAPVLVVIGKKDIQVDWQLDGDIIAALAKQHANITFVTPENANHVLKHEPRERSQLNPAEVGNSYNAEGAVLDADTLRAISAWLDRQR